MEIKMHTLIVILGGNQEVNNWVNTQLDKYSFIEKREINKISKETLKNTNFPIINIDANNMQEIIDSVQILKREEFSMAIIHGEEFSYNKKDPLTRFYKKLNLNEELNIIDYDLWNKCHFRETKEYLLIGDVHENIPPLKEMLNNHTYDQLIFLGDYLDKGYNTGETIDYMYKLHENGAQIVIGNHESYVAKKLLGKIDGMGEGEEEIFTSLDYLKKNEKMAQKFLDLFENSLPFANINTDIKVHATHAPCHSRYFTKLSSNAQRNQRNFYFKERGMDKMREELSFLDSDNIEGLHVFGHVAHQMSDVILNNRVWLDTGSVYGNKLSALKITKDNDIKLVQLDAPKLTDGNLFYFENKKKFKIT